MCACETTSFWWHFGTTFSTAAALGRMAGKSASSTGRGRPLAAAASPRTARLAVAAQAQGPWCAKCQNSSHWTYECFQKSERANLREQLSYAIAASETRQVALRQRKDDLDAQRELHRAEMQMARDEQAKLAARIDELERNLVRALKEERRLLECMDKLRLELNDSRTSFGACVQQCEHLQERLLAAYGEKEQALTSASEAAAHQASIEAQKADAQIAQAKVDADAEVRRCLREAAHKFGQDMTASQMQTSDYAQRCDALQASLAERRREIKGLEKQLSDEREEGEGRAGKAAADTEARVKMTMKGLRKELSESSAAVAEYKQRCEALQAALLQAQLESKASAACAAAASAQHQVEMRNCHDEMEAQRALHSAEAQLAEAEQAALTMQIYELEIAAGQRGEVQGGSSEGGTSGR